MENNTSKQATQLSDLVQILTDRIEGYTTAISSMNTDQDVDLIAFFEKCMQLSQQFKTELLAILPKENALPPEKQPSTGSLYDLWQAEKPRMEGLGREQALEAYAKMEATMQSIFSQILSGQNNFTENTAAILKSQAALQQEIYEQIQFIQNRDNEN